MRNVAAMRKAMQSIARDASSARLGEKLPKERRQALLISIGVEPEPGEDYEKDPRGGPQDPDAEIYGSADDDDPELPGRVRRR